MHPVHEEEGVEITGTTQFFETERTQSATICPTLVVEPIVDVLYLVEALSVFVFAVVQRQR